MDPTRILYRETLGFFSALAALLAYRMLTRQINLSGLLTDGTHPNQVSPERVQLLVVTLAVSARYIGAVLHSTTGAMPDIEPQWLVVFGTSGGLYAAVKTFKMLGKKDLSTKTR